MVRIEPRHQRMEETPEFKRLQKLKKKKAEDYYDSNQKEKKYKPRKRRSCPISSCCFTYIIFFIVFCIFVIAMLAKIGMFNIPIFSDIFYRQPEPLRIVVPTIVDEKDLLKNFEIQNENSELTFELDESQLTYLINSPLQNSIDVRFDRLQAVITSEDVELFGHLVSPVDSYLTINILPKINQGLLDFEVKSIKVGSLPLPAMILINR